MAAYTDYEALLLMVIVLTFALKKAFPIKAACQPQGKCQKKNNQ